jgi:hypothetical protein
MNEVNENSAGGNASKPSFGISFMALGALVAFSPIFIAISKTSPGSNWMSEGDSNSGGAYLWLLMFTLPIGGVIGIYGLVKLLQGRSSKP